MKLIRVVTLLGLSMLTLPSIAADSAGQDMGNMKMPLEQVGAGSPIPPEPVEGEVRQVNKAQGKVTLRHGYIKNLDMPAMTMAYKVQDNSALDNLAPGDKVMFSADRVKGSVMVTTITKATIIDSK